MSERQYKQEKDLFLSKERNKYSINITISWSKILKIQRRKKPNFEFKKGKKTKKNVHKSTRQNPSSHITREFHG